MDSLENAGEVIPFPSAARDLAPTPPDGGAATVDAILAKPPTISLCVISGNEEGHAERFLNCFAPAFDELCLVRAVGRNDHDRTVAICKKWCDANGKRFKFAEYKNAHLTFCHPDAPEVLDDDPSTWPHVDDFAAARNMSWALATGNWQFWADLDDIIDAETAGRIRACALTQKYDFFYFHYSIKTSGESNYRERMFRTGISHWSQPVHENCHAEVEKARNLNPETGKRQLQASYEKEIIYSHEPMPSKERDPMRNMRIMKFSLRYLNGFAYEIHKEHFYRWGAFRKPEDMTESFRWANIARQSDCLAELKQGMLLNLAEMLRREGEYEQAIDYAWQSIRMNSGRRDPWGVLAELELESGQPDRAARASEFMQVIRPPADSGLPVSDRFMGASGLTLRTRTLRAAGYGAGAEALEDGVFARGGAKFSLLHATRGRPEMARRARENFFKAAFDPIAVEHTFAIDSDDHESLAALKDFKHIVIDPPGGCVRAWNAAAAISKGKILVQLSDDWVPCMHWDEGIWREAEKHTKERGGEQAEVGTVPLVFAISDNHRTDSLLCMAILTRARYEQQKDENTGTPDHPPGNPYLFAPEYFGVYSDNEFTVRAHRDGVVIDCRYIRMDHQHPVFEGKPPAEWDATHKRQNDMHRYAEGEEIFRRRNPWAVQP